MNNNLKIIISVVLGIVIIIIVAVIIYFVVIRSTGGQEGAICRSDVDCAQGFYCGGPGRCHAGNAGSPIGGPCSQSVDCQFGLACLDGICANLLANDTTTTTTSECPLTDINIHGNKDNLSLNNVYLYSLIDGQKYYLNIGKNGARLGKIRTSQVKYQNNNLHVGKDRIEIVSEGLLQRSNKSSHIDIHHIDDGGIIFHNQENGYYLRMDPKNKQLQFSDRHDWPVVDLYSE